MEQISRARYRSDAPKPASTPGTAHGLTAVLCLLVGLLLIGSVPLLLPMPLGWLALQIVMAIVFLVAARYHLRRARLGRGEDAGTEA